MIGSQGRSSSAHDIQRGQQRKVHLVGAILLLLVASEPGQVQGLNVHSLAHRRKARQSHGQDSHLSLQATCGITKGHVSGKQKGMDLAFFFSRLFDRYVAKIILVFVFS
jgi:hypothetical protein